MLASQHGRWMSLPMPMVLLCGIIFSTAEGQTLQYRISCGDRSEITCGPAGAVSFCANASGAWTFRASGGGPARLLPELSTWHQVNDSTCGLILLSMAAEDAGVYSCCVGEFASNGSCAAGAFSATVTLNALPGQCSRTVVSTRAPGTTAPATRPRPPPTQIMTTSSSAGLQPTEVIIISAALSLGLVVCICIVAVCHQRYTLAKLRSSRHQGLNLHKTRTDGTAFQRKMTNELRATNITATPTRIEPSSRDRRRRKRGLQHSVSEPQLRKSPYGSKAGFKSAGLMGFGQSNIPSAYEMDYKGFQNNMYRHWAADESADEPDNVDDLVRRVMGERKQKQPLHSSTIREELEEGTDTGNDSETGEAGGSQLVRHFSWHSPDGGFAATMKSGEEVSSPFAHFVSKRMVRHRSATLTPVLDMSSPLTEEELEEMLTSDPEMSTVDHDTGTEDVDMDHDCDVDNDCVVDIDYDVDFDFD